VVTPELRERPAFRELADGQDPWASQMHAKPHRGNTPTARVYMDNDHWLVAARIAPRFKGA
jgi:hypothetical protein